MRDSLNGFSRGRTRDHSHFQWPPDFRFETAPGICLLDMKHSIFQVPVIPFTLCTGGIGLINPSNLTRATACPAPDSLPETALPRSFCGGIRFVREPTATPSESHENQDSLFNAAPRLRTGALDRAMAHEEYTRIPGVPRSRGSNTKMKGTCYVRIADPSEPRSSAALREQVASQTCASASQR
jgi:hypothetical protein